MSERPTQREIAVMVAGLSSLATSLTQPAEGEWMTVNVEGMRRAAKDLEGWINRLLLLVDDAPARTEDGR